MAEKDIGQNLIIELKRGQNVIFYTEDTNTVTHFTRHGVSIECAIPEDWGLTRIFQFMESLFNAKLV